MSESNAQDIFAKLGCNVLIDDPPETCERNGSEFLRRLQTLNVHSPNTLITSISGTEFVELFKNDSTNQPLSQSSESFIALSELQDEKDEITAVWNRIVAMGMQENIKDRKFLNGKCFNCNKAAATYLLYPCFHLNRCKVCFLLDNTKSNFKCLLCGKQVTGYFDVISGNKIP